MDLSLVLPCPGGFDGPPFPGESHIPALILDILESCVIVLQYYLCEDTIPAPAVGLQEETEKVSYIKCGLHDIQTEACVLNHYTCQTKKDMCIKTAVLLIRKSHYLK